MTDQAAETKIQGQALSIGPSAGPLVPTSPAAGEGKGPATVAHVTNFQHRYPGEVVTFFTLVRIQEPLTSLSLRISIPKGLEMLEYRMLPEKADTAPHIEVGSQAQYLTWSLSESLPAGARYEYQVDFRIAPSAQDRPIESQAMLFDSEGALLSSETIHLGIEAKGRYLRYLPALYEQDEFMGRFLMLFESFWAPIETQIDAIHNYLDPKMAPVPFLPWLASWLGLNLDNRLSEEQQRELIRWAIWLFRRRGTRWALQRHLEIYCGGQVQIVEHRASDFRLGPSTRLGRGVALGKGKRPHAFTVYLRLPPDAPLVQGDGQSRKAREQRQTIEAIIEAEKPAHTDYTLVIRARREPGTR
jgi:phage tail-like protein